VFELFPRLLERAGQMGNQLSGGEQQMLAIGRALMTNAEAILLDEATEGLATPRAGGVWPVPAAPQARGTRAARRGQVRRVCHPRSPIATTSSNPA